MVYNGDKSLPLTNGNKKEQPLNRADEVKDVSDIRKCWKI